MWPMLFNEYDLLNASESVTPCRQTCLQRTFVRFALSFYQISERCVLSSCYHTNTHTVLHNSQRSWVGRLCSHWEAISSVKNQRISRIVLFMMYSSLYSCSESFRRAAGVRQIQINQTLLWSKHHFFVLFQLYSPDTGQYNFQRIAIHQNHGQVQAPTTMSCKSAESSMSEF